MGILCGGELFPDAARRDKLAEAPAELLIFRFLSLYYSRYDLLDADLWVFLAVEAVVLVIILWPGLPPWFLPEIGVFGAKLAAVVPRPY